MTWRALMLGAVSSIGLTSAALAQDTSPPIDQTPPAENETPSDVGTVPADNQQPSAQQPIVITGIRSSLERAAEIKQNADQVVDSIIADDIGKFPDPTTAAALQRVPGVQVTVGGNNEITGVLIRGLSDILTTVDGRELFSTAGRTFEFQDLPAEALARVDVIKSSTADLIEGGIAGITDLQLNKAFDFQDPTVVVTARGNHASNTDTITPQLGFLATDTWETGIGDIGALINVTWSSTDYNRPYFYVPVRRSGTFRFDTPGVALPNVNGGLNEYGNYERPQANASLQWQASSELEIYADGLFTGFRSDNQSAFVETQFFNEGTEVSDIVTDDNCFDARVTEGGFNPRVIQNPNQNGGQPFLEDFTVQNLCNVTSATFRNARAFTSAQSRTAETNNYLGALGFRYEKDAFKLDGDFSYQDSTYTNETFIVDIGKPIEEIQVVTNDGNGGRYFQPGNPLYNPDGFFFRNGLNQNFTRTSGDMLAAQLDAEYEIGGIIDRIQIGGRFADRSARSDQALVNIGAPGGDMVTPISDATGLPSDFLVSTPGIPRQNNGAPVLIPNPDYLRSDEGRDYLRGFYGLPLGDPEYQAERRFDAQEKTYAAYIQAAYDIPLGDTINIDGLIGVRPTRTERTIAGAGLVDGVPVPVESSTTDTDVLPNASARIDFGGGLQARANYSKTVRRPGFGSLNPGVSYVIATNPNVINSGSAGNPDLRPQKSDSYDATLEYYFQNGFLAVAAFYREISDRIITSASAEVIDGNTYNISRPRNLGAAELKGVEVSGQTFFDFLPGALSGFGVFGNYTLVDSEVTAEDDNLFGETLQGVSKHNFNAGLLYEKFGLSTRLVYTYRSRYYDGDATGLNIVRPIDADRVDEVFVPTVLNYVRPGGRLDLSIAYDLNEDIRLTVGGTNILRNKYKSYFQESYLTRDVRYDDSIYTFGIRARF
ncbi:TonB-dependent receptor [Pacificimonas flava]|uniref:TonB-dependent receptor n=1 Tax=Pacificimonas flava TaxID=1234595 RepID=M2U1M4_9SPHN|nr:TonB-dependent receptor [Pacificimonas flava]EMD81872.1 TonB-dependent receptor [Pacificimonas flava]MBB5281599.1 TonB-dependent receptor [Pacificimonas flava]